jgi:hypothetical protein
LAQSFQGSPIFKAKCAKSKQSPKAKAKTKVVLCYPRALKMPLYKECKKLFISSSSPIIIISYFQFPLPSQQNFPPTSLFPWVGMTMQKGTKKNATVLRSRSDW